MDDFKCLLFSSTGFSIGLNYKEKAQSEMCLKNSVDGIPF